MNIVESADLKQVIKTTARLGGSTIRGRTVASAKRRFYRALRYGAAGDSDEATVIMGAGEETDDLETDVVSNGSRRKSKSSLAGSSVFGAGSEAGTTVAGGDETTGGVLGGVLPEIEVASLMEKAKFYTSLCLGSTAILAVFAFLFAIPFVVEPAISTILADFSPRPVACVATSHVLAEGLKNCSWASCREGSFKFFFFFVVLFFDKLLSLTRRSQLQAVRQR